MAQWNCLCMIHADKWMLLCFFILLTSRTLAYLHSSYNVHSRSLLEFKLREILSHACHKHARWITLTYHPQTYSTSVTGTLHFLIFCRQQCGIRSVGLGNLHTWNSAVLFCHTREQKEASSSPSGVWSHEALRWPLIKWSLSSSINSRLTLVELIPLAWSDNSGSVKTFPWHRFLLT